MRRVGFVIVPYIMSRIFDRQVDIESAKVDIGGSKVDIGERDLRYLIK